jgi:hypothetical protein
MYSMGRVMDGEEARRAAWRWRMPEREAKVEGDMSMHRGTHEETR